MNIFLIGAIGLGIILLADVLALIFISGSAREEARRIYRLLDERYSRLENDLRRAQDERSEAQQEARRLEKRLREERTEKQDERLLELEQERQHLLEELERWHGRYTGAQKEVERLKQERSEAGRKIEQLTQLRERLLEELREIGKG